MIAPLRQRIIRAREAFAREQSTETFAELAAARVALSLALRAESTR